MKLNLYEPPFVPSKKLISDINSFMNRHKLKSAKLFHIFLLKEYFYYTPLPFKYIGSLTLDTKTAYDNRMGNCFALTNLFVFVCRQTGLNSYYYFVKDITDNFLYDGTLITTTHIICRVDCGFRFPYIIDFLPDAPENYKDLIRLHRLKRLTDLEAAGLFYNNLGCKFLLEKNYGLSEYMFCFAKELFPDSPRIINNLGVLYRRTRRYEKAVDCFLKALKLSDEPQSIISNIIKTKKYLPDSERVKLEKRISSMLKNNYYWHLMKAEEYIAAKEYKRALKEIRKADKLSPGNQEVISFYLRVAVLTNNKKLYEKYKSKLKYY